MKFGDGHIVAKAGSIDEDPEGRLHLQLEQNIQMSQMFLLAALSKVKEKYAPKVDDILSFLYSSPIFLEMQRELISEGLAAFQSGDYVKSIHVLIPQIEQCTRTLLSLLGIATDKPVARQPGINDVKNMNDVLSDERVQTALSENVWRYFYVLFVDRRGLNLRNRVAHGLVSAKELRYPVAAQVFHSLLTLSLLRVQKPEQPAQ